MSSVDASNAAYAAELCARLLRVPQVMLEEAARAAFTTAVSQTLQDSGQAAASWDLAAEPLTGLVPAPRESGVVGFEGEQRSARGMAGIVIEAQVADMEVKLEGLMELSPTSIYIDNPVDSLHAVNAFLPEAWSFAGTAARLAAQEALDRLNKGG